MFSRVRQLSISWAQWIQVIPAYPVPFRFILMLSSHYCLSLLNGLFTSAFLTKVLYEFLIFSMPATCPVPHFVDLFALIIFCEVYKLWSSSLSCFLHSPFVSSLLGPCILSSALWFWAPQSVFFPCGQRSFTSGKSTAWISFTCNNWLI
jgi:hypothetical protein